MQTVLLVLGIWIGINILFVLIMIPPRKSRRKGHQGGALARLKIHESGYSFEEEEKVLLRHVFLSIAIGVFFSLAPPLIELIEAIKSTIRKRRS